MFIVTHRSFFFWLTGLILVASIGSIAFYGLPLSIEFTGGSQIDVAYAQARPALSQVEADIAPLGLGSVSVRENGSNGVTLRAHTLSPEQHVAVLTALGENGVQQVTETQSVSIGPSLGSELATKAFYAFGAVILAIVLYIAWAFRKVSKPVPSWGYGITVIFMLAIDIIVPTGFFAAYAHFTGAQFDTLVVIALLALLGYCVNDVIVIFDRVREHLGRNEKTGTKQPFEELVGRSINETMARSINTALTVVLVLLALIFVGSAATRVFALVMLVGVVIGTFSSIARSAPLLIPLANAFDKKR
jgi:preprotein translocase subunit SecF